MIIHTFAQIISKNKRKNTKNYADKSADLKILKIIPQHKKEKAAILYE